MPTTEDYIKLIKQLKSEMWTQESECFDCCASCNQCARWYTLDALEKYLGEGLPQ